ncbi:MAG: hypothetical protein KGK00_17195 [Paracoccaceae bacterium]|nr:hypothetical protein [Paracoccaceae bacterium]
MLATAAHAERVVIQSGEHDDFSRLVLQLQRPSGWVFGRYGAGYQLRLARPGITLDVTRVFDRIPKRRLEGVSVGPGEGVLTLRLPCVCNATIFQDGPLVIVIDLRNGPPREASPFEDVLPPLTDTADPGPIYNWKTNTPGVAIPVPKPPPVQADPGPPARVVGDGLGIPSAGVQPPTDAAAHVQLMERLLAADIARATTAGLLEHASPQPSAELRAALAEANTSVGQVTLQGKLDLLPSHAQRIAIAAPFGDQPATKKPEKAKPEPACLPDNLFDFRAKTPNVAPSERIANLRSRLVTEFDRPDVTVVRDLVHVYLSLGFGAEAQTLPEVMKVKLPDQALVDVLAHVVDNLPITDPGPLRGQETCDGPVALWALLASANQKTPVKFDRGAILRGFAALPLNLRRLLGGRLATRMLDLGDTAGAHAVTSALSRIPGAATQSTQLAQARLDLATDRTRQADATISRIAESNGPKAAEAALLLVETSFQANRKLPKELPATIASWAKDYRGTPLGARLEAAYPLALALGGQMDAAFSARTPAAETSGAQQEGANVLFAALARDGTDEDILRHGLAPDRRVPSDVREILARRVLALGFPEASLAWLDAAGATMPQDLTPAGRLLVARSALALGRTDLAQRALAELEGPDGSALRAQVLKAEGAVDPALAADGGGAAKSGASPLVSPPGIKSAPVAPIGEAGAAGSDPESRTGASDISAETKAPPGPLSLADQRLKEGKQLQDDIRKLLNDSATAPPAQP